MQNMYFKTYCNMKNISVTATKTDLRASGTAVITTQEGKKLKKKIR